MNLERTLDSNSSFIGETVMLLVIMTIFIVLFTYIDIVTHDTYALPWGSMCYTGNTNKDCLTVQQITNCPNGGDACIEAPYAKMLSIESGVLGFVLFFIKLSLAKLLKRKINEVRFFQAIVWGVTPFVLLWTGYEDFLYYAVRHMPIPDVMPWMNTAGLFPYVDQYILHITGDATSMSLYVVMSIGFAIVIGILALNIKVTKNAGYVTPF